MRGGKIIEKNGIPRSLPTIVFLYNGERIERACVCVCGVWDSNTTNKEEKDYNDCDALIKEQESF